MNKNPYQALFDLISKNAKQFKSLYQINKIQLKNKNEFIHTFFENLLKEGELSNLADFAKHEKLIFLIKTMFKNSFEPAGGKQYRFYHSQNVAYLANIIAHNLNLSETDRDIVITQYDFSEVVHYCMILVKPIFAFNKLVWVVLRR